MSKLKILDDAIARVGFRKGFEKGYRIELDRIAFLKKYTLGQATGKMGGWIRKLYVKLFNQAPWEED